jgi:Family of unknown function (DUF5947)
MTGIARLRRLAAPPAEAAPVERCELCGEPIPPEHRHLVDVRSGELLCACRGCGLLMDRPGAGGGHYRVVGDRRRRLVDFRLDDDAWAAFEIPVDSAFFVRSTAAGRVVARYAGPTGAVESALDLAAWDALERANPVLVTLAPDVEALLVHRARGAREHWLLPLDDCYRLVAIMRTTWRGLAGGPEVWTAIGEFFDELEER